MTVKKMYFVRHVNTAINRRYVIQRNDTRFWGRVRGWVVRQTDALLYRYTAHAQQACRAFTRRQARGKPCRRFRCSLVFTVRGDGVDWVTPRSLGEYLLRVLHVGMDYEVAGDGPVSAQYVEGRVDFRDLTEVETGDGNECQT